MNIFITIHAISTWNEEGKCQGHCDAPLSSKGKNLANLLSNRQELLDIDLIYTSDLKRSYQTLEPLSQKIGKPINKLESLREGRWQGHHIDPNVPELPCSFDYEDELALINRSVSAIQSILKQNETSKNILICTHGAFLRSFIKTSFPERFNSYKGIRTALNRFLYKNNKLEIVKLNDDAHLWNISDNNSLDFG
jgi:broad specificity phosphatase PhoE